MSAADLALSVPLHGTQLIEASAGTGKTYTLAGIYTRLIVERRLAVRQVLVVTFTKAATEELKSRLRARLVLCAEVAAGLHDAVLEPAAELAQSRALIAAALREEPAAALQSRLRLAALELDTAQISTIHGFCQRALREHGVFAGASADGELVASDRDVIETLAADLWRERAVAGDALAFAAFAAVTGGAPRFARLLPRLLDARDELVLQPQRDPAQARAALRAAQVASAALADAWRTSGTLAFAALLDYSVADNLDKRSYSPEKIREHAAVFARCFDEETPPAQELLQRYAPAELASKRKSNKPELAPQAFFEAIPAALEVFAQAQAAQRELGLHLLAATLSQAQQRLDAIKRAARRFCYDDLIRRLHAALTGAHAAALARALREQYPYALVDEFQDTDADQFAIFNAIYAAGRDIEPAPGALLLIGDPKQAIYRFRGGDIHTYLAARAAADGVHALDVNFRSTPGYLRALEHLYTFAGDAAFADARIAFEPVAPGGAAADDDLLIDAAPATPLTVWHAADDAAPATKLDATERLAAGCAAAIADLLQRAQSGRAQLRDGKPPRYRALEPRDLAVLVGTHDEAIAMQAALAALNIPSVCLSKRSVFATEEARELHLVLDALIERDPARYRAALATRLLGCTLAHLADLAADAERWSASQLHFVELQRTWHEHGVLAMLERLFAARAADLLAIQGGERRMTNWLQLADLLQAASAQTVGPRGLADWLAQRIARADDNNEDEQLRLESDADRVQVRTLHASKGLEYPIVFLPFVALRRGISNEYPKLLRYRDEADCAAARYVADKDATTQPVVQDAQRRADAEDLAERLRVLYVGLTRARHACFVAAGVFGAKGEAPALLHLLRVDLAETDLSARVAQRLQQLVAAARTAHDRASIVLAPLPAASAQRWRRAAAAAVGAARQAQRHIHEWRRSYSFSSLAQLGWAKAAAVAGNAAVPVLNERAGADDESDAADPALLGATATVPAWLRGARFGTAFHEILEVVDFAAWRDWRAMSPPPSQRQRIEQILAQHALTDTREAQSEVLRAVTALIAATLNAPLPLGARLADVPPPRMRAEMPFHFAIAGADPQQWLRVMHRFGYLADRPNFALDAPRLAGLMTGVLDLVVEHAGRWWVIDYKTNLLAPPANGAANPYAPSQLARAVRESEYDLQYLIYLVALHRWLKSRRGAAYDYTRDIGGALYLFVRGLDTGGVNGVHRDGPPAALIEALDQLLAAPATERRP